MPSAESRKNCRSLCACVFLLVFLAGCSRSSAEGQPAAEPAPAAAPAQPAVAGVEQPPALPPAAAVAVQPPAAPPAPAGPPQVVKDPAFGDSKKTGGAVVDAVGKAGDTIKDKGTHALLEMQAARYFLLMSPEDERDFYAHLELVNSDTQSAIDLVAEQTDVRLRKLHLIEKDIEQRILAGKGPPREVRQKFVQLENFALSFSVLGFFRTLEPAPINRKKAGTPLVDWSHSELFKEQHARLLQRMVRGRGPTAGDVLKIVHRLSTLVKDFRECESAERRINEVLVLVYPGNWSKTENGDTYYGLSMATAEKCLSSRLSDCSSKIEQLYAHAKLLHEMYLSNSPDKKFPFEFPPLSPEEMKRAEKLLSDLKKAWQKGRSVRFEEVPMPPDGDGKN